MAQRSTDTDTDMDAGEGRPATTGARGTRQRDEARSQAVLATAGVLLVLAVGMMLRHSAADQVVTAAFAAHDSGVLGTLAVGVYTAIQPLTAIGITVAAAVLVATCTDLREGFAFGTAVALAWLPVWLVKAAVDRPRPEVGSFAQRLGDPSYPSGHTAFIAVLAVALILETTGTRLQTVTRVVGPVVVVLVIGAVLVLGVHFPTDIAASLVWAATVTPLAWTAGRAAARSLPLREPGGPRGPAGRVAPDAAYTGRGVRRASDRP